MNNHKECPEITRLKEKITDTDQAESVAEHMYGPSTPLVPGDQSSTEVSSGTHENPVERIENAVNRHMKKYKF